MTPLVVEALRGGHVESSHRLSAVVVDARGTRLAHTGDSGLRPFLRSAAKPFQAIPLVADGVLDRLGLSSRELALACASHNSEPEQVELVRQWLARIVTQRTLKQDNMDIPC